MTSKEKVTILDGGFSSQLSKHMDTNFDKDPLWTARLLKTSPEVIIATHLDYLRAGSEIIETNTYQASIKGFTDHLQLTEEESFDLIKKAVHLAKEAINLFYNERKLITDDSNEYKPLVAGSCGPYGAFLHDRSEYTGSYHKNVSKDLLKNWHKSRVDALVDGGVDILAFETIPCELEAQAIVELLKDYPNTKAWISFSCSSDGKSIVDGSNFKTVACYCYESSIPGQIIAVGINCIAPSIVSSFFKDINGTDKSFVPLIVYPNSGETWTLETQWQKTGNEPSINDFVDEWLDLGVRFIGSCCRTYAEDITSIKKKVQAWQQVHTETSS
ncbi:homocysteine S-methyltransferase 1-like [Aphidius gifuensis]|uniref:homocysteine S-methyltransferase 1-like n=1 Tax=Aphidius gifuensis TaxID=684658 RepID=UPI001CDB4D30|nr:homocysteine S-methyltransferase 1-like [Aphidius gifuensis]